MRDTKHISYDSAPISISSDRLKKGPSAQVRKSTTQHGGAGGPRSTRVDFSMGMTNLGTSFRPHLTRRMGSADTARQLRVTIFDHLRTWPFLYSFTGNWDSKS